MRKRAVGALGHLAAACSTDLFVELADHLLDRLPGPRAPASPAAVRTLIQCLGSVGRQAGHRLGKGAGFPDKEAGSRRVGAGEQSEAPGCGGGAWSGPPLEGGGVNNLEGESAP